MTTNKTIDIPLLEQPAYTPRRLRVVVIGAGFSGLTFAHKYQHECPDLRAFVDLTIFEALDGVGGTWRVNTYPGVQCDVPAHVYAFPFDPNPNWRRFYADGDEILEYIERTCDKWDLRRHVQFRSKVLGAEWQEEQGKWKIQVESESCDGGTRREVFADVLITAVGVLSRWKWPSIPGLHDFRGHITHSAAWDHAYDYSHKRIGIIGNGSSAIQILPQMARLEGTQVTSFQRGPTWITPSLGSLLGGQRIGSEKTEHGEAVNGEDEPAKGGDRLSNPVYSKADIERFQDPEAHRTYRRMLQQRINKGFRMFRKGSKEYHAALEAAESLMRERLNHDASLCDRLIPTWELGCRRLTPGDGYLESFLLPNVHLAFSPITRITETGIETESESGSHPLDVVICATGFDASNIPDFPVTGRNGIALAEKWRDEPHSYLSLACPDFPNYFLFTGPNATVGHGALLTSLSWSADWMIKWLRKMATEDIRSIVPTQSATDDFVRYGDRIHATLTWTGACSSWYKNHRVDGRVTATFPGSALLYRRMIAELRPEDFEIAYCCGGPGGNRFRGIMGHGFTADECEEDRDLAFYI
ncbi:hypothetical protein VTN02DRAFT_420 [Thermoascus thermophilus]